MKHFSLTIHVITWYFKNSLKLIRKHASEHLFKIFMFRSKTKLIDY